MDGAPPGEDPYQLILNGWFLHDPEHWPPHPRLHPLIVSFHITPGGGRHRLLTRRRARDIMFSKRHIDYLRRHGPVGARDRATLAMLTDHKVEAYLSGCLTLTLKSNDIPVRTGEVVAVDVPDTVADELARRCDDPPVRLTHRVDPQLPAAERAHRVNSLLASYAGARCVVTTRLHAALPCLALGTPVLFIGGDIERYRIEPALELAHNTSTELFLSGRDGFNPLSPPPNPDRHLGLAAALEGRCRAFMQSENAW